MSKKFVIIDAMALAYKAYFAFITRPLITSKGEPSSAVFGFINQLIKILEDTKPDYAAVAFDSHGKTFRHEQYADYKANRAEMPDDMRPQIDRIKQIVNVMNIKSYILERYEADDIIGTAVCKAEKEGYECYVITPDKDYNQLVTDNVKIIRPGGKAGDENVIYDVQKVRDEFGFEPKQMIDYLALTGDASDNIPGVAGIGPKSATPLIQQYGSVEGIYEHIDAIEKAGIKKKLVEGKDKAFLSKELATIHCLVPLEFNFEQTKLQRPDFTTLQDIFVELEFKTFYSKLLSFYHNQNLQEGPSTANAEIKTNTEEHLSEEIQEITSYDSSKVQYQLITSYNDAKLLADKLQEQELFVYDTETDGLKFYELNIAGVSFSTKPNEGYYVAINPFEVQKDLFSKYNDRLTIKEFVEVFKPVFENKKIKKVCQNGKFDISVLRNYGIEVENFYFDTMLASYVLDPDQKHGMDDLSQKYLGYQPIPLSNLIGAKKDASKIMEVDLEEISRYSSEDADVTYKLYDVLKSELDKLNLNKIAYDIEFPLVPVLEDMERTGIRIDVEVLKSLSAELQIKLDDYTKSIYNSCGEEFNINSPIQLQRILFEKLGLKTGKKTKTGYSTDAKSLETLKGEHEIIELILDYRQVAKLKSTYTDSLPNLINPVTGRIHTSFSQTTASTGRLSSVDPNLQNIPIRTELGKEIRKAFVPADKNHIILSADYSQIELRIMAAICGDEALVNAFKRNEDIHRSTASLVFMVPPEEVTPEMRRRAKEVNFGILYGIGPFGLKTRLGITQYHAKEIIETYFNTFKRVKFFMDDSIAKAQEKGYAETILGRRRILRNINSSNRVVRQFEERVSINMPIQGTAADMIKLAMINIHKALKKNNFRSKMVLQVHDELLFDAHKDEINELTPLIKELMETALPMDVPIVAETGTGENWLDAH